ncbi:hypothetical protein I8752_11080 [Nostocaceae cyanobacterium CENA369]|uniref:Uncharacterized protein n=1 Tax=Dendronalium phyllosphericum CENA369 TaxID=1725256 RepID=A0A8J7LH33_9NOST|nr:hypothetical protein [Dendronalium phyllosphericum]MBH8573549.1 hypothetical protein [Dendronalium phyllosphericum CENA369]
MQSSSVSQTMSFINHDSSFSDNQMAYRLALMMEKYPNTPSQSIQSTPALDITERENIINEMKATLSLTQNAQSTEDYRHSLKNKYLKEYTQKLRLHQADTPEHNSSRVENLINEKKKTFLQQMLNSQGRKLPLVDSQQPTPKESENNEVVKKSLIPALMNIVMTKGHNTNSGRIYEGIAYRLQLLMREGMQRLTVWRKSDNQSAFSAYKADGNEEYKLIHNNLSPQETQKLIDFDIRQQQQQPPPQQQQNERFPDGPDLD